MAIMSLKKMLFAAVGITMAAAATLEELAKGCNVTTQVLEDLISIEDYANVDATKFAGFFQQPVEVVAKWPASVKKDILPLMAAEIKYYQNDQQGESPIMAMAAKTIAENGNGKLSERNVDESAQYIQYRTQQLTLHEARMQASNSGCTQNAPCLACISSASLALLGAIAGCAATAAAEEAIWAGITFGIATAPIWLKLVACIATAGSVAAGAVGTCYTLL
ncbi:hypothetical protein B0T11DRAFT_332314 [Plectosphaerella cucumerina]|jgi:hypothetical protein|uniref:Uncharacterized protein n=1 Tax=Plectosphaerella cucumerina TaxID=40658 RepID=A0A8K0T7A5_9PEZI|nr:hypothetical protein B0T11DRAFT_332314 [Plectosphaerella cucumerina]